MQVDPWADNTRKAVKAWVRENVERERGCNTLRRSDKKETDKRESHPRRRGLMVA